MDSPYQSPPLSSQWSSFSERDQLVMVFRSELNVYWSITPILLKEKPTNRSIIHFHLKVNSSTFPIPAQNLIKKVAHKTTVRTFPL